jgi:hypothetical protein
MPPERSTTAVDDWAIALGKPAAVKKAMRITLAHPGVIVK